MDGTIDLEVLEMEITRRVSVKLIIVNYRLVILSYIYIVKLETQTARRNCSYQETEDGLVGRTECADRLYRCTYFGKKPNFYLAVDHRGPFYTNVILIKL